MSTEAVEPTGKYSSDPSERAKQLVAEGRIGGARFGKLGGRPRVKRAGEIAAEKAAAHADDIVQALRDGIDPHKEPNPTRRAQNAAKWLELEQKQADADRREQKDLDKMKKEDLVLELLDKIGSLQGAVPELEDWVVDSEAEVIDGDQPALEEAA